MTAAFLAQLQKKGYLVTDGAMGTNLFKRGLETGDPPEFWNIDHPDRVASVHQEFVDAGCDSEFPARWLRAACSTLRP